MEEATIDRLLNCDFCTQIGQEEKAEYDGKTTFGVWAFICLKYYDIYGIGLGMGRGQMLILEEEEQ